MTILLSGCGTVVTRTKGDAGAYHGFGYDMEKISNASEWMDDWGQGSAGNVPFLWPRGVLWVLDVPLSLVSDTLLLPVDALRPGKGQREVESEVGQPDGAANRGSETNRTSAAAGPGG